MTVLALLALQTAWKPYTLDGFAFQLPSPPVEQKDPNAPKGTRYWLSMHNDRNTIVVMIAPLPKSDESPDSVLSGMVAGVVEEKGTKLLAQSDAVFNGWPALAYTYRMPDGLVGSTYGAIVGDKLVGIVITGASEAAIKPPLTKAIAGFGLLPNVPKGPLTLPGPAFTRYKLMDSPASTELPSIPKERTGPVSPKPGAAVLHTQDSPYGNRFYSVSYADVPMGQLKENDVATALQTINDDVVRSLKGKPQPSLDTKLDGAYAIRTVASIGDNGFLTVVSTFREDRIYVLLAVIPAPWKAHPEPKRFFDSFKAGV